MRMARDPLDLQLDHFGLVSVDRRKARLGWKDMEAGGRVPSETGPPAMRRSVAGEICLMNSQP
jgi:hypothetical protein